MSAIISDFTGAHFFLSNFHPVGVYLEDGHRYATVEHAYQAAKTLLPHQRTQIRNAQFPGTAKRLGKSVQLRPDWETFKFTIMRDLLKQKFRLEWFAKRLEATQNATLIEGNLWHDVVWGKCGCSVHRGQGDNRLGEMLMEIRAQQRSVRA